MAALERADVIMDLNEEGQGGVSHKAFLTFVPFVGYKEEKKCTLLIF